MPVYTPDLGGSIGVLTSQGAYTVLSGQQEETVSDTALTELDLTVPRPERATGILAQAIDAGVMFTLDGTDPTVTPGFVMPEGLLPLYIPLNDENTFTVVREDATDASFRYAWVRVEN